MPRLKKNPAEFTGRPVWAEVSISALTENLHAIRDYVNPPGEKRKSPRKVLSIVKGNAYGHGGPLTAKALERAGSDWFGVASADEGIEIRKAGVRAPILVLGGFWPGEEKNLLKYNLTPAIHRCEQLLAFNAAAARASKKRATFQLKIDTGMNRLGISPKDMDCFIRQYAKARNLQLTGVFTHFASSGVLTDTPVGRQTHEQMALFYQSIERLRSQKIEPGLLHLANSAAIAARPDTWADMVRPGAILYGYHPGFDPGELRARYEAKLKLRPVMSLRSRLIGLRSVAAGDGVGYDATWRAERPSRVAVLAAGYGDGIHRSLGNRGCVHIRGHVAPMIGIISMDVTMLDVTGVPDAAVGDIATVYGEDGERTFPASAIARSINTVTSDLLCAVSQRVPRFYLK